MSNITTLPPLLAFVIMMPFLFCRWKSVSHSDFVRLSQGGFLVFEDFIAWLATTAKVSTQLGNLSGNQLVMLLNLGSFALLSVDRRSVLSLTLRWNLKRSVLRSCLLCLLDRG